MALKAKPFDVKKAALSATPSGRVESLARPKKPLSPVGKRLPREKDKYGRPIFEMPVRDDFFFFNENSFVKS